MALMGPETSFLMLYHTSSILLVERNQLNKYDCYLCSHDRLEYHTHYGWHLLYSYTYVVIFYLYTPEMQYAYCVQYWGSYFLKCNILHIASYLVSKEIYYSYILLSSRKYITTNNIAYYFAPSNDCILWYFATILLIKWHATRDKQNMLE